MIRRLVSVVSCAAVVILADCSGNSQSPAIPSQPLTTSTTSSYSRLMTGTAAVENAAGFSIKSTTFKNDATIPPVMRGILAPQCDGRDFSPTLFWSNPPAGTKSFALVLFDETANFGHWGIYNMRPNSNRLPQDVRPVATPFWMQVTNDLGTQGYFGPCPPPGIVHRYVFTLYALDTKLSLPTFPGLPGPTIETLFRAMIDHVVGRTSITGFAAFK